MYRLSKFEENFKYSRYVECIKFLRFKGKLCTYDVQIL